MREGRLAPIFCSRQVQNKTIVKHFFLLKKSKKFFWCCDMDWAHTNTQKDLVYMFNILDRKVRRSKKCLKEVFFGSSYSSLLSTSHQSSRQKVWNKTSKLTRWCCCCCCWCFVSDQEMKLTGWDIATIIKHIDFKYGSTNIWVFCLFSQFNDGCSID